MDAAVAFAVRITIFVYKNSDSDGWPSDAETQKYVRFLQDRGIDVGFRRDSENDAYVAMIDSSNVGAHNQADKLIDAFGVKKPPLVPDSMIVGRRPFQPDPAQGVKSHSDK